MRMRSLWGGLRGWLRSCLGDEVSFNGIGTGFDDNDMVLDIETGLLE